MGVQLPVETGQEFQRGKGDIWIFNMADFGFSQECIELWDIERASVVEGGNDGWQIASIVTTTLDDDGEYSVLSSDIGVDRWIDGNGPEERRRFDLTLNEY